MEQSKVKTPVLLGKKIVKTFGQTRVLNEIDIEIYDGDVTVIMGTSGSGKSTLLYCISGMEQATDGNIRCGNQNITGVSEKELTKLQSEKNNMAIYKSLGLHTGSLRISFALRFLLVVLCGGVLGFVIAGILADSLIGSVFRTFGIGEFETGFSMMGNVVPLIVIPVLFALSAWFYSAKLSRVSIVELISEDGE